MTEPERRIFRVAVSGIAHREHREQVFRSPVACGEEVIVSLLANPAPEGLVPFRDGLRMEAYDIGVVVKGGGIGKDLEIPVVQAIFFGPGAEEYVGAYHIQCRQAGLSLSDILIS